MVLEGLRGYLQLATGLTDVTRERARAAARALVAQGEAGVGAVVPPPVRSQVTALTDDLLATSRANRGLLVQLVRGEVERSVARLGLASSQDLAAATRRADRLERRVAELEEELRRSRSRSTAKTSTARKSAAKSTAKKSAPTAATTEAAPTAATTESAPTAATTTEGS